MWLTILNGIGIISFYFLPTDNFTILLWVNIITTFIAGPTPAIVWSIYTDVIDYGEWKLGTRITALTFAAAMFTQKIGLSIGGAISGWLLAYYGFLKDAPIETKTADGISAMFSIIPGALAIITALILIGYKLTDQQIKDITTQLQQRRKNPQ